MTAHSSQATEIIHTYTQTTLEELLYVVFTCLYAAFKKVILEKANVSQSVCDCSLLVNHLANGQYILQFLPIAYTLFAEFGSLCQNSTHKPIRHSTWRLTTHIYAEMKHCNQNLTLISKNEILATKPYTQAPFELLFHITSNTLMGFI